MGFVKGLKKRLKAQYDVEPEENIPRKVYGIPHPSKYDVKSQKNILKKKVIKTSDIKCCPKCGGSLKTYVYDGVKEDIDQSKFIVFDAILADCIPEEDRAKYHCPICNIDFVIQ